MIRVSLSLSLFAAVWGIAGAQERTCIATDERAGLYHTLFHDPSRGQDWSYLGPARLGFWRIHPYYAAGIDEMVRWVDFVETLALNAVSIWTCEPGSLEALRALQDEARYFRQLSYQKARYSARDSVEWSTYLLMSMTAEPQERMLSGDLVNMSLVTDEALAEMDELMTNPELTSQESLSVRRGAAPRRVPGISFVRRPSARVCGKFHRNDPFRVPRALFFFSPARDNGARNLCRELTWPQST